MVYHIEDYRPKNRPEAPSRLSDELSILPPQNIDAEEEILGGLLFDPGAIERVMNVVQPEDFYTKPHKLIYQAALWAHQNGHPVDMITVSDRLQDKGQLDEVGGKATLVALADPCISALHIDHCAQIVASKARRRRLIQACSMLTQMAYQSSITDTEIRDELERRLFSVMMASEEQQQRGLTHISEYLRVEVQEMERLSEGGDRVCWETGFYDLDQITYGLQPKKLVIGAGRPGMGKSALVANVIRNVALRYQQSVALFSLEMDGGEVGRRLISAEAGVDGGRIMKGDIRDHEWESIGTSFARLSDAPIFVDDSTTVTPAHIKTQCMKLKNQTGSLSLVVVDYLHLLLDGDDEDVRALTKLTRQFKKLAGELNCCVVLLSQLNRAVESQANKRPSMKDLRASGSIEQDADQIWMLYRDEIYNPETQDRGVAEINVVKHRGGPTGTAKLLFEPQYTRFRNLAR